MLPHQVQAFFALIFTCLCRIQMIYYIRQKFLLTTDSGRRIVCNTLAERRSTARKGVRMMDNTGLLLILMIIIVLKQK